MINPDTEIFLTKVRNLEETIAALTSANQRLTLGFRASLELQISLEQSSDRQAAVIGKLKIQRDELLRQLNGKQ